MIKRYSDFINEGLTVGELPSIDWLNLLCEDLIEDLNVVILTDRLCDDVGRLVSATDGRYIINNEVFGCTEIHFQNKNDNFRTLDEMGNSNLEIEKLYTTKLSINRLRKKIESESYKVIVDDQSLSKNGGYSRLVIYPINTIK